jgi:hypothetical protein
MDEPAACGIFIWRLVDRGIPARRLRNGRQVSASTPEHLAVLIDGEDPDGRAGQEFAFADVALHAGGLAGPAADAAVADHGCVHAGGGRGVGLIAAADAARLARPITADAASIPEARLATRLSNGSSHRNALAIPLWEKAA